MPTPKILEALSPAEMRQARLDSDMEARPAYMQMTDAQAKARHINTSSNMNTAQTNCTRCGLSSAVLQIAAHNTDRLCAACSPVESLIVEVEPDRCPTCNKER